MMLSISSINTFPNTFLGNQLLSSMPASHHNTYEFYFGAMDFLKKIPFEVELKDYRERQFKFFERFVDIWPLSGSSYKFRQ